MPEDPIWAERRRQKKAAVPLDQQKTFQFDIEDFSIEEQREMALEYKFAKELEKRGLFKGYKKPQEMPGELILACESAVESRSQILPLQNEMTELVDGAENDIERDARLFQIDLIARQLNRAADVAEKRLAYFKTLNTPNRIATELEKCKKDIVHWFEYYAWGVDPRPDAPLNLMPFALFEFQERFVKWLDHITFVKRTSGVCEKARDMGATETALRWQLHKWLFTSGFHGMALSANEDLVDSKKDPSTLFEKLRMQLRLLPPWMLPKGFDLQKDMPYMLLMNPVTNSVISGDAPTANIGRQRRATFVQADEYAAWPYGGYPQHTALSRTTNTFCPISSALGRANKFADICFDGVTAKFVMDWREHPFRDERWYKSLPFGYIAPAMTEVEIAAEIDRNFEASQPGRVFTDLKEEYCFITWDELVAFYAEYKLDQEFVTSEGLYKIPVDWEWGRNFDWGQTPGHKWAYSVMARPPEDCPLNDSVFVFCAQPMPWDGTTEQQFVAQSKYIDRTLGLRNDAEKFTTYPQYSECSHEQADLRDTLLQIHAESYTAWDTDYQSGISQMRAWFARVDQNKPNPFRPQLMGRATIYFVAPKGSYQCAFNPHDSNWFVTPSDNEWSFKLLREELQEYHYGPEERFKPLPLQRPVKKKDDVIDCIRAHGTFWGAISKPLTAKQKYDKRLKAMLPTPIAAQMGTGVVQWSQPGEIATDITLEMNEMMLKSKMRQEGEYVRNSPFEDESDEYEPSFENGW